MNTYVILRRGAWGSPGELELAAGRSKKVGDEEMSDDIRWIRSYVLSEPDGRVGTVCVYQASSPEAIHEHASRADLAADEIIEVADTVVIRPDPAPAGARSSTAPTCTRRRSISPRGRATRSPWAHRSRCSVARTVPGCARCAQRTSTRRARSTATSARPIRAGRSCASCGWSRPGC